jgi:RAP domain
VQQAPDVWLQVVIEVDPPSHFSTNSHRPLGRTVGRRCMLEARGYTVRSIAYYEWATLESDALQQAYLTRLLASCF